MQGYASDSRTVAWTDIITTDTRPTDSSPDGYFPTRTVTDRTITREKDIYGQGLNQNCQYTTMHRTSWRRRTVLMKVKRNKWVGLFSFDWLKYILHSFSRETTQTNVVFWVNRQRTIFVSDLSYPDVNSMWDDNGPTYRSQSSIWWRHNHK